MIQFMVKKVCSIIAIVTLTGLTVSAQSTQYEHQRDSAFFNAASRWFEAWKLVYNSIYALDSMRPVDLVFFDDAYVYTTSAITAGNGVPVKGPTLMHLPLQWRKAPHDGKLTLPDSSVTPVRLMSFAAELPDAGHRSFFVMPLPSFWRKEGVESKELGLDNLLTGVFLHEFSHSQQMQNFGKKISAYEKESDFGIEFNDDIVQHIFKKDSLYLQQFNKELHHFYSSVQGSSLEKAEVREGLKTMNNRQQQYFTGKYQHVGEIDNFFLTMEGLGQYSMYLWMTSSKGGNIARDLAIKGIRRGGKWWSQDEGLALFLILDRLVEPRTWSKGMFGYDIVTVVDLINKEI
ncbi:MAG TPA: hypothetical protein VM802_06410 [Chitinophaga sp.]|uniref:hypothetical protein n=1 Tax=Chitinophaga sp. TaxID=1869181 RepID=UPI002BAAFC0C|nr:hypothetical protein [Chitinophaga sp.]HVI44480.1 hypothetical protein [Chitinophaga sp.]